METRRRIDLCTCGKPRDAVVHHVQGLGAPVQGAHTFMPNPQPPSIPDPTAPHRIYALRLDGVWVAEVHGGGKTGIGQAAQWMDAVNAALEDLKEKTS